MEATWAVILTFMLTIYIVLDGFDFGAGIIYFFFTKNEEEKQKIRAAIGPFWDGNEVWLVAAGGVLFGMFPTLYASAFSGFYLALMLVLWFLIFRGISIELRGEIDNKLWHDGWDFMFGISSFLLALFFGVAFGNVVRGVNLGGVEGGVSTYENFYSFFTPLWSQDFSPLTSHPGIIDWFTIVIGLIAVVTLTIHGANWIIYKTRGELSERLRKVISKLWFVLLGLIILSVVLLKIVKQSLFDNYADEFSLYAFPLVAILGLAGIYYFNNRKYELNGFLASSAFIIGGMATTVAGLWPIMLPSTNTVNPSLTIYNASASAYGLEVGIVWWTVAFVLVLAYSWYVHKVFSGKVEDQNIGH